MKDKRLPTRAELNKFYQLTPWLPQLVILEGPDCAGKTHLAKKLVPALNKRTDELSWYDHSYSGNYSYSHLGPLSRTVRNNNLTTKFYDPDIWAPHALRHTVQDRLFLSEYIYAKSMSLFSLLTLFSLYNGIRSCMDRPLSASHGAMHIILLPSDDLIRERFKPEEEMYTLDEVLDASERYKAVIKYLDEDTCTNLIILNVVENGLYLPSDLSTFHVGCTYKTMNDDEFVDCFLNTMAPLPKEDK